MTSSLMIYLILISVNFSAIFLINKVDASESAQKEVDDSVIIEQQFKADVQKDPLPANHKMEIEEFSSHSQQKQSPRRQSRQYDGTVSSSSVSSNYAAIANDAGAYIGQMPSSNNYVTPAYNVAASNYINEPSNPYHSTSSYHDLMALARGYSPTPSVSSYPPITHHTAASSLPGYPGLVPHTSMLHSASQLPGFSSSMFPLMGKGFDVSEIVCTAIAVAIGAVIVGAPFILIYLFIMNQMNGGSGAVGPNGGSISLTGPTSSTTVSGRKKRHTSLPEALFKQLSPLVNNEQVALTFKTLMNSLAKYQ